MPRSFHVVGEWESLGDDNHLFRFVKGTRSGEIIGGVLRHNVKGESIECEPGLVQWEPFGEIRPLFSIATTRKGEAVSVTPFIVCEICGDKGFISRGKWVPKDDEEGVDQVEPMRPLEAIEGDGDDPHTFELQIRRELGDVVLEEELGADRKHIGIGEPDVRLPDETEEEIRATHRNVFVGTDHDPQWQSIEEDEDGTTFDIEHSVESQTVDVPQSERVKQILRANDDRLPDHLRLREDDELIPSDVGVLSNEGIEEGPTQDPRVVAAEMTEKTRRIERVERSRRAADREVLDSGHRHVFETGAQRDRAAGKGRFDLLQWMALPRIAVILEKGADKYEARNWERGMPISRFVDSAVRHLGQYIQGMTDEDHLGQAAWNLLSAMQTEEMIVRGLLPRELNDLPTYDEDHFDLTMRETT